jgi:hypothetical protein
MAVENISNIVAGLTALTGGANAADPNLVASVPAQTTTPSPTPTPTQTVVTPTPTPVASVTIPLEQHAEFTQLKARLAQLEAQEEQRKATAQDLEIQALKVKGHYDKAAELTTKNYEAQLATERQRLKDNVERTRRFALDGELARELASRNLVDGGAAQLTKLIRDEFVVEDVGDTFAVKSKDFKPVGEWIGAMLGRPENAHWLKPQNPAGGTGGGTGTQTGPTSPVNPGAEGPKNLTEAVMLQMAATARNAKDPRLDRTQSMGLRATNPGDTQLSRALAQALGNR